jgi:hypothetical protein
VLDQFDADCADDGPLALIRLDPATVLPRARDLVCTHSLRTLDAMHLAVALGEVTDMAAGEPVVFVTRDAAQAAAARALGFETA